MWIWKDDYLLLKGKADLGIAAQVKVDMLMNLVFRLEAEIQKLEVAKEQERHRAEAAIDEMVKFSAAVVGYTPRGVAEKSPERHDPEKLDNLFEEEDQEAVKHSVERIVAGGPEVLFEEYHGTND